MKIVHFMLHEFHLNTKNKRYIDYFGFKISFLDMEIGHTISGSHLQQFATQLKWSYWME